LLRTCFTALESLTGRGHDGFHIVAQISRHESFPNTFIDSDGLEWLHTLNFPLAHDCDFCGQVQNKYMALSKLFGGKSGYKKLKIIQIQKLFSSAFVYMPEDDWKDAPDIIRLIRYLSERLTELGSEEKYVEVADICESILAQQQQQEGTNPGQWDASNYKDQDNNNFGVWVCSMQTLIDALQGTKLLTIKTPPKSTLFRPETPPWAWQQPSLWLRGRGTSIQSNHSAVAVSHHTPSVSQPLAPWRRLGAQSHSSIPKEL
jgi:hypothetical protein